MPRIESTGRKQPDGLITYAETAAGLMFRDEKDITEACTQWTDFIIAHSQRSDVYNSTESTVSKIDLQDKTRWYIPGYHYANASTGGSTSGVQFQYRRWVPIYDIIENKSHYGAILKEFGIKQNPSILYLIGDRSIGRKNTDLIKAGSSNSIIMTHGAGPGSIVHEVVLNSDYFKDCFKFYKDVLDYIISNDIDVILASGGQIAALTWHAIHNKVTDKLCALISNTNSKVDINDLHTLRNRGLVDNWCDHMRCWDGGVTFTTCPYNTYHLIDTLSWAYTDNENRLISYDYFSLPAPFVNYWNGDYAEIGTTYTRCQCGRLSRSFKLGRTRDMMASSSNSLHIKSLLSSLDMVRTIKRAEAVDGMLRIITTEPASIHDRRLLRGSLQFELQFITEEPWT